MQGVVRGCGGLVSTVALALTSAALAALLTFHFAAGPKACTPAPAPLFSEVCRSMKPGGYHKGCIVIGIRGDGVRRACDLFRPCGDRVQGATLRGDSRGPLFVRSRQLTFPLTRFTPPPCAPFEQSPAGLVIGEICRLWGRGEGGSDDDDHKVLMITKTA